MGSRKTDDMAYCLGLYRTRRPNNLGIPSIDNLILGPKRMPRVGTSCPGLEVYYHTEDVPGFFTSTFLILLTKSPVVVLTNSLPFVGQLLAPHLLEEQPHQNLLELCNFGRYASLASYLRSSHCSTRKAEDHSAPSASTCRLQGQLVQYRR